MPAICEKLGLRFDYPDNWQLEAQVDEQGEGGGLVLISPETAFWQISRRPTDTDLEPLFDEALAALRAEYHEIEAEAVTQQIENRQLVGYDVNFYCLDLTNTYCLRGFKTPDATYLSLFQAEDREFQRVAPVLQAMFTSLFRNLAKH
jgi:hypothetical protein